MKRKRLFFPMAARVAIHAVQGVKPWMTVLDLVDADQVHVGPEFPADIEGVYGDAAHDELWYLAWGPQTRYVIKVRVFHTAPHMVFKATHLEKWELGLRQEWGYYQKVEDIDLPALRNAVPV